MHKNHKLWFTLIELIVVITILAILGTIAFIAMQGYSKTARDSKRISDVSRIKTSLELFKIEAATYPEVTDGYEVTYSWATARTQGTFWEQTFRNVEKLDKVPLDPTTDAPYAYSVTSSKKEYQVASIIETDLALTPPIPQGTLSWIKDSIHLDLPLSGEGQYSGLQNIISQAEAARTKARARITWTYNGKTLKVSKGIFTMILAAPSIVSSEYTPLETQLNNNTLAYDGFSNLPASYEGTNFETKGEGSTLNLVNKDNVELFSWKLTDLTDVENWANARKALVNNIQTAYSNTRIATSDSIARLLSVDTTNNEDTENTANYLINNDSSSSLLSSTKSTSSITSSDCSWTPHGDTKDFWSVSTVSFAEWQSACDTAKKTFTCDNWSFIDWINFADTTTYKYSSCVVWDASNCIAWSVIWTDATYSYSEISHWLTGNGDWSINVTNWTQNYSSVISCNNWEVTIDSETAWSLVCDSTYHEESWTCVSDSKTVSCTATWTNPTNSTENTSEQVTINYVNWAWETAADCTWTCNENYTENAWACEANSNSWTCSWTVPTNATKTTPDTFAQTWDWSAWAPGSMTWTETASECDFDCNLNYTWNSTNTSCEANTQDVTCSWTQPDNTTLNSGSTYTQTWNGTDWSPTTSYNYAVSWDCSYSCNSLFHTEDNWNTCVSDTKQVTCTSWNNPANSTEDTTELVTINYVSWAWETAANCSWTCDDGYVQNWSTCEEDTMYSLRFNDDDSAYLSRTPSSAGNRQKWTWSGWVKRSAVWKSNDYLMSAYTWASNSNFTAVYFHTDDKLYIQWRTATWLWTKQVFRDTSAWAHIVITVDTWNSEINKRLRLYVNWDEITDFDTDQRSSISIWQNFAFWSTGQHILGAYKSTGSVSLPFDWYLSNVNFIDWKVYDPTKFGYRDSTTGQWLPMAYSDPESYWYGTNWFHLDFSDSVNLWNDKVGSNNWTVNNIDSSDQMLDSPVNNFATLNPLSEIWDIILSQGNTVSINTVDSWPSVFSSLGMSKGKWYFESTGMDTARFAVWISSKSFTNTSFDTNNSHIAYSQTPLRYYDEWVNMAINGDPSFVANDILWIAVDIDTWKFWLSINGTYVNDSRWIIWDPVNWNNPLATFIAWETQFVQAMVNRADVSVNFGQWWQAGLTYYPDAGGSFKYAPPTGFKALSTKNIPDTYSYKASEVEDLGSGLVSYWNMDWNLNDLSGNSYNGADNWWPVLNTPWVFNWSTTFDWVDDNIVISDSPLPSSATSPFSVSLWMNSDFKGNSYNVMVWSYWTPAAYEYYWWYIGTEYYSTWAKPIIISLGDWDNDVYYTWNKQINDWKWHNITMKYDWSNYLKLYVDWVLDWEFTVWAMSYHTNTYTTIGSYHYNRWSVSAWQYFKGSLDDIAIWNRELSDNEITQLYNAWTQENTVNIIKDPSKHFDVLTWTATNAQHNITWLKFQPDLVWWKKRSSLDNNVLVDVIRWSSNELSSNTTWVEYNNINWVSSFNSDWFSLVWSWNGSWVWNGNAWSTHVAWNWKAGWTAVTNNKWNISSQVSANPDAWFSIISWTWNWAAMSRVWHWLNMIPEIIINKNRDQDRWWDPWFDNFWVYHKNIWKNRWLMLNNSRSEQASTVFWNIPTESTIWIWWSLPGSDTSYTNNNWSKYIAYAFHSVPWYSKVWSYTGNWNTDGPFVYTGFKPRYILAKPIVAGSWHTWDTQRNPFNIVDNRLYLNDSRAELTGTTNIDILSNGFKLRPSNGTAMNDSWQNFIYIAFAEAPFKYANAR